MLTDPILDLPPLALAATATAPIAWVVALVGLNLGARRVRVPAAVWWAMPALALGLGGLAALGVLQGATPPTAPEAAARWALATRSLALGAGAAAFGLLGVAWCASLAQVLGAGPGARPTPLRASGAALVGLAAAGTAAGAALVLEHPAAAGLAALTLLAAAPPAIAALRTGQAGGNAERTAAGRVLVGASAALSVLTAAIALALAGDAWHVGAALAGDPAVRAARVALGRPLSEAALATGAAALLPLLLAAGLPALLGIRPGLTLRSTLGAAAALGLLLPAVVVAAGTLTGLPVRTLGLADGSLSRLDPDSAALLPVARVRRGAVRATPLDGDCILRHDGTRWRGEPLVASRTAPACPRPGAPVDLPLRADAAPIVALPAGLPAAALSDQPWFTTSGTIRLLVRVEGVEPTAGAAAWAMVPLRIAEPDSAKSGPPPLLLSETSRGTRMFLGSAAVGFLEESHARTRLQIALLRSGTEVVHLVPGLGWSVQDLVTTCLTAQDHAGDRPVACRITGAEAVAVTEADTEDDDA